MYLRSSKDHDYPKMRLFLDNSVKLEIKKSV